MRSRDLLLISIVALSGLAFVSGAYAGDPDCNNNGVPDAEELSGNDCNANGVLDVCENDTWPAAAELTGVSSVNNYIGGNIDIDGDTAVVGDPLSYIPGVSRWGRVFCYTYFPGAGWLPTQSIREESFDLSSYGGRAYFGDQVAVSGDHLVVTAPARYLPNPGARRGSILCFRRIGGEWQFEQELVGPQPDADFGWRVVLEGNRLFTSDLVTSGTNNASVRPHVYCYVDHGEGFELEQTIPMGSWLPQLMHVINDRIFNVRGNVMVKVEVQPSEAFVEPLDEPTGDYVFSIVIYEWSDGRWNAVTRMPIYSTSSLGAQIGYTDCFIDLDEDRIIMTPSITGDNLSFYVGGFVVERDQNGWHLADVIETYFDLYHYKWIEKSENGYFVGPFELTFAENGPVVTNRPDLAGVADRSGRSGNWWGAKVGTGTTLTAVIDEGMNDCNSDGVLDACEIAAGAPDVDGNLVPDTCQMDCNGDGIPDESQLDLGDCNGNGVLDVCDVDAADPDGDGQTFADCNGNLVPDVCEPDCDGNGVPDDCDLDPVDPDGDGLVADDCDENGRPDACDIRGGLVQVAALRPGGDITGLSYGASIALDGEVLAVGALADGADAALSSRVYIYRRHGESWDEEAMIAADSLPEDLLSFGYKIALEGDTLVIKGQGASDLGTTYYTDYFFTYEYDGSTWQHTSTFSVDQIITAVSDMVIDGNRLAISTDDSRAVTIYENDSGVWNEAFVVSLLETDGSSERIALHGDTLIVGYGVNRGQIFRFDGATWQVAAYSLNIGASFTTTGVLLARPVTNGDVFVFGNRRGYGPGPTNPRNICGTAQLYRFAGGDLIVDDVLFGNPESVSYAQEEFGASLALAGDRLIVGAPAYNLGIGRIHLFERERGNWVLRQLIDSPVAPEPLYFGSQMAVSGDTLAVAASGRNILSPSIETDDDVVFIYETDLDVDDDGILDTCETDCDGNHYPDDGERTIDGFASALLRGGAACVFDMNDDGAVDGLDVAPFVDLLVTGP